MAHVFGEIDCPHCGEKMKVKADKNGDPFGHCEHCSGQLRVGGKTARVENFFRRHSHLQRTSTVEDQPPSAPEKKPAIQPQEPKPPEPPKKKIGFSFFDQLNQVTP